ncbi:MAG: pantetheine-phosphate adenylyltransferase [Bacteriovoracaceae bacterium]|nr:pantetheine-phosphate adenylyltransferase [Bacteriovoracaceae bacterium]
MKTAIYPGTFDPFTRGHDDIIQRALRVFDEITVLVAVSPAKKALFSQKERVKMIKTHFEDDPRIKVDAWDGLIVEYAKKKGINAIVRGLRPTGDFEMEFQMASMNNHLYGEIDTFFLPTGGKHYFVSSSLVKELYKHGRDVSDFVPEAILKNMEK